MDRKDKIIEELRGVIAELSAKIEQQAARIEQLELELAKAKKDSSTSSKPPSSDIVDPKSDAKKRSSKRKRRKGGQPGHQRQLREPLPLERVDETITWEIDDSEVERLGLTPTGEFEIVQRIELPESPVHVTEYRLMQYRDAEGNLYTPDDSELAGPIFGPRLLATIGWLKSVGHMSYSTVETWMEDVLGVPVSRGYLSKLCTGTISSSLKGAYQEVADAVPRQEQLGSDETSIKDNGKETLDLVHQRRDVQPLSYRQNAQPQRAGEARRRRVRGYLNFDYFSANCSFAWTYWIKAQYCWAHLIRDIRFLSEKHPDKPTKDWAEQLLDRSRRLFSAWHRRDEMTADGFRRSMTLHRDRFWRSFASRLRRRKLRISLRASPSWSSPPTRATKFKPMITARITFASCSPTAWSPPTITANNSFVTA